MDFYLANKMDAIHTLKKAKLQPLTTHKYKKQQKVQLDNRPRDPRIATFDSLELNKLVCCEGIKLGNRQNKSVEKRSHRKLDILNYKAKRQSINENLKLIKTTTLDNLSAGVRSILIRSKGTTRQPRTKPNPEDAANLRSFPTMARGDIMVSLKEKNLLLGFIKAENLVVALHRPETDSFAVEAHPYLLQPHSLLHLDSSSYLVVDQCSCQTLKSLIAQFGKISPKMAAKYLQQIVSALSHLQRNGVSHNRINLQSILHNGDGQVLVNWAKSSNKCITDQQKNRYFHYFSPELITSKSCDFGEKSDVWGIGCVALQLLSLSSLRTNPLHPYNRSPKIYRNPETEKLIGAVQNKMGVNSQQQISQLKNLQATSLNEEARQISASGLQFIAKCLTIDLRERPAFSQLLSHPFLN